ncbi:MAG: hypothetical protein ACRYFR_19545 [Janthinobacterium lividum]
MKTIGKLLLLLSFVVIGRWSRSNPPVIVATFAELAAPANLRTGNTSNPMVLVRHKEPTSPRQVTVSSALALF